MSLRLWVMSAITRASFKQALKHLSPGAFRRFFNIQSRLFFLSPSGVRFENRVFATGQAYIHAAPKTADKMQILFYIHGGGFVFGGPRTHRHLAADIAKKARIKAVLPAYPLSPEHRFPAAIDTLRSAYDEIASSGYTDAQIIIAGDSAGGNLALLLLAQLRSEGRNPGATVLISPLVDLRQTAQSYDQNKASDCVLPADRIRGSLDVYCDQDLRSSVQTSPVFADFEGASAVLIQSSRDEVLSDDSKAMAEKLRQEGCDVTHRQYDNGFHVFHLLRGLVPEANQAVDEIAAFINQKVAQD